MKKTTLLLLALLGLVVSGSVGAAPSPSVTIAAYGQSVTLSGTVSSHKAGETVTLASESLGKSAFSDFATATTMTHGTWNAVAKPTIQTMYRASWMTTTSQDVTVKVRPLVQLKLISAA